MTGPDDAGDFFPRYSRDAVLYTTDNAGSLSVHARSESGETERLTKDSDAFAGRVAGDTLIYSSFSSQGYIINAISYMPANMDNDAQNPGNPVAEPPEESAMILPVLPASETANGAEMNAVRYTDVPKFLYWLPVPVYYNPFDFTNLQFGAGILLANESVLGTSGWQAIITSRFDVFQPGIDANAYISLGTSRISLGLSSAFYELADGSFIQEAKGSGVVQVPLIWKSRYPESIYVGVSTGLTHRFKATDTEPFGIAAGFAGAGPTTAHFLNGNLGANIEYAKAGGSKDIFDPFNIRAGSTLSLPILGPSQADAGIAAALVASVSFPSLFNHHVIKASLKTGYTATAVSSGANVRPRGSFLPEAPDTEGRYVAAVDYLFNIALLDIPLPFDLHFLQLAGGLHTEISGGWGIASPSLSFDGDVFPGFELIFVVGRRFYIPIGIGLSFKLTPGDLQSFTAQSNIRPYLFTGINSFTNSF